MRTRERYCLIDWLALAICIALPVAFWWLVIVGLIRLASFLRGGRNMDAYYPVVIAFLVALLFVAVIAALCFWCEAERQRKLKEYHAATIEIIRSGRWKRDH